MAEPVDSAVCGQAGAFFSSARNAATTVQQQRADTENGSSIEEAIDRPLLQEQVQCASVTTSMRGWGGFWGRGCVVMRLCERDGCEDVVRRQVGLRGGILAGDADRAFKAGQVGFYFGRGAEGEGGVVRAHSVPGHSRQHVSEASSDRGCRDRPGHRREGGCQRGVGGGQCWDCAV